MIPNHDDGFQLIPYTKHVRGRIRRIVDDASRYLQDQYSAEAATALRQEIARDVTKPLKISIQPGSEAGDHTT